MATITDLLDEFREAAHTKREKGTLFEKLIVKYLLTDPQFDQLGDVWLWNDWPDHWGQDVGIDIVAQVNETDEYWAIQCKFFEPKHCVHKKDIDSFFTASGKRFMTNNGERSFINRLIISTTDLWSKNAEQALDNQAIEVHRLGMQQLIDSPINWDQFSLKNRTAMPLLEKKKMRGHQLKALEATVSGFKNHDRGKLIMACGTGKTLVSLRIAETVTPDNGLVLFLAPSISLISQSLQSWKADAQSSFNAFVVCSDSKVGKDEEDIHTYDIAYPATTNSKKLITAIKKIKNKKRKVIFSTYQSLQVVADAQSMGLSEFDLIICDEAHRTTGVTLMNQDESEFVKVHVQEVIRSKKRLYMTATPRIYNDKSRNKADRNNAKLYSMDDEKIYGPEFYRLGFGEAVHLGLLAEYKVLIVAVNEEKMAALANDYNSNVYKIDSKKAIDSEFAAKIIGSWKGLSKNGLVEVDNDGELNSYEDTVPMQRAVAFSRTIKNSKSTTETFSDLVNIYSESHEVQREMIRCELKHVDGTMNTLVRQKELNWLKENTEENVCRILSNARCLSEGIDVPALDAVIFFNTRDSIVDIVQSVGRVMRKPNDKKKFGYIILPVCIPTSKISDYNNYIENDKQFKGVWKVIKALRAHDESLVDEAEFKKKIKVVSVLNDSDEPKNNNDSELNVQISFSKEIPIEEISNAVYAAIPKKLEDTDYWISWAENVADIAQKITVRIITLLEKEEAKKRFSEFLFGLRENINPKVTKEDAIEMLTQHVITRPIFDALFEHYKFTKNNPVSKSMQKMIEIMDDNVVDSEVETLEGFYKNVRQYTKYAKSDKSRQNLIKSLYDTFFKNAFPDMAERLGIVYTPVEIVDFILNSVEYILQKYFHKKITERDVHVLDPFTGTGTFIVRLLQSGHIAKEDLLYKYKNELHANEIVLLAYYIAAINIETTFHTLAGEYSPFDGIVLADTFQMSEKPDWVDKQTLPENNERLKKQNEKDIRVVFGNPPYSGKQKMQNDNNQNIKYKTLDSHIRESYAKQSSSTNLRSLYDSYIRAIRWSSDRIKNSGIVAFVHNSSLIRAKNMDGLRKCLNKEFSYIYVFNLLGDASKQGEERRDEGGGVFGAGSKIPVSITIMVKDPKYQGDCKLYYNEIGTRLNTIQKLNYIEEIDSIKNLSWKILRPNQLGDWINQRDPSFMNLLALGEKNKGNSKTIFSKYSQGVLSGRDAWVYNFSADKIKENMFDMIKNYNLETDKYIKMCSQKVKVEKPRIEDIVNLDPQKINWTRALKKSASIGNKYTFDPSLIVTAMYRPFVKQRLYFNRRFNEYVNLNQEIFPTRNHDNIVIIVSGTGAKKSFGTFVSSSVADFQAMDNGQCFPLYWYEKKDEKKGYQINLFDNNQNDTNDSYIKKETITDWALKLFQDQYRDKSINKIDIFWYVFGVLNSSEYQQRFSVDLKLMLPRIPLVKDFWAFSNSGKRIGVLQLNYESVTPWPLEEEKTALLTDYKVSKMRFEKQNKKLNKKAIVINDTLTLRGVPLEAYDFIVNGKSAIEWIMDRYSITIDNKSGIQNNPNDWSQDPVYIINLLKRIVRISVECVDIIKQLPSLDEF
ncbi:DEAD/DEAH box helicase [Sporolactobacillus shoreae]|uniref:DEAD/DEAH box helicase n=1 Tax=Sporolactobacillus shoreae TaxID=1465501 RepID=A0A4Z0GHE5_9BACL|nr:type ISP restriction/modification enzyme [Sporolactobacillus shoreae]TGA95898.1 DEAD/DEAH box helicase [Sporolactobacillus shoreae]